MAGFEPATSSFEAKHSVSTELHTQNLVSAAGFEPATPSLEAKYSVSAELRAHIIIGYGERIRTFTVRFQRPFACQFAYSVMIGSGNGIRTRVVALKGLCPWPLDDAAINSIYNIWKFIFYIYRFWY